MIERKIGRSSENDIVITNDKLVSRFHAVIHFNGESYFIEDLGSSNGTFVNGNKIQSIIELDQYDILKVGNSLINWKEAFDENDELTDDAEYTDTFTDAPELQLEEEETSNEKTVMQKESRSYVYYLKYIIGIIIIIAIIFVKMNR
ncbi:MAG: FHA domain-containing protein [Bacteroidetes bacterium]|nr:FHA domain-containing protein [Bacteroidota bacterium]